MARKKLDPEKWLENRRRAQAKYYEKNKARLKAKSRRYYADHKDDLARAVIARNESREERSARRRAMFKQQIKDGIWRTPAGIAQVAAFDRGEDVGGVAGSEGSEGSSKGRGVANGAGSEGSHARGVSEGAGSGDHRGVEGSRDHRGVEGSRPLPSGWKPPGAEEAGF